MKRDEDQAKPVGRAKGGVARAASMTPAQLKSAASKAAKARWDKKTPAPPKPGQLPIAAYKGTLDLGGAEIPAYVLSDGQRVIGRTAFTESLTDIKGGGSLEKYLGVSYLNPYINMDLVLERMVAFTLPEVEGLEKNVKGLPADLAIDIWRGFVQRDYVTQSRR